MAGAEQAQPNVGYADVIAAASRIEGSAHRTPIVTSRGVNAKLGATVFFKCENFQRAGAFKFRGAFNAISAIVAGGQTRGVVAYSSGNHAQAVALASSILDVRAVIIMPEDAPEVKRAATAGYGAEVRLYNRYTQDREALARHIAQEEQLALVPPYDDPLIIAGQGTAAKELIEDAGELDLLLVPLGGGGLLAGSALSAHHLSPGCKVIGVEPELGNDGQQSLRAGEIVRIPVPKSIADGAVVTHVGTVNFPLLQKHVEDIVTVPDEFLVRTMHYFAERMKLVVEPTGCLAAAALLFGGYPCANKRVGVLVSGGNIDLNLFCHLIAGLQAE